MSDRIRLIVEEQASGIRLDRYIADQRPELTRSFVRQLIDKKYVYLNEQHARPSAAVRPGDVAATVPEPQTLVLAMMAMGGAMLMRRKQPR